MKFSIIILSLCFFLPLSVKAQVSFGAQFSPHDLAGGKDEENIINSDDIFADAFVLELGSAAAYGVFKSTEPEKEIEKYINKGFYRQEMIMLFFMALESSASFKNVAEDIEKGKTLEYAAVKNKVSLMEIFKKSEKTKKKIESGMVIISAAERQLGSATGKKQQKVISAPERQATEKTEVKKEKSESRERKAERSGQETAKNGSEKTTDEKKEEKTKQKNKK